MSLHALADECHERWPFLGSTIPFEKLRLRKAPEAEEKLNAIEMIVRHTMDALRHFWAGDLSLFDPSLGDQACEMRALQVCLLKNSITIDDIERAHVRCLSILRKIVSIQKQFSEIAHTANEEKKKMEAERNLLMQERDRLKIEMNAQLTVIKKSNNADKATQQKAIEESFRDKFKIISARKDKLTKDIEDLQRVSLVLKSYVFNATLFDVQMDARIVFLASAYLLTKAKIEEKYSNEFGVFTKDMTRERHLEIEGISMPTQIFKEAVPFMKRQMIGQSITFVRRQAKLLDNKEMEDRISVTRNIKGKDQDELPQFYTMKIVMLSAMQHSIPVILKIRNNEVSPLDPGAYSCRAVLKADKVKGDFLVCKARPQDAANPAIVVESYTSHKPMKDDGEKEQYLTDMFTKSEGFLNFVDLFMAQHGQYSDQEEASENMFDAIPQLPKEEKSKLVDMMHTAIREGFARNNSSQAAMYHIFPDQIGNQIPIASDKEGDGGSDN